MKKISLDDLEIDFNYKIDSNIFNEHGLHYITGELFYKDFDEDFESYTKIILGTINGYSINLDCGFSFGGLDAVGPDESIIGEAILSLINSEEKNGGCFHMGYLVIDRVFLKEEYRNKGYGTFLIKKYIDTFSVDLDGFFTFVQPAYIEEAAYSESGGLISYGDPNESDSIKKMKKDIKERLINYYTRELGFSRETDHVLLRESCNLYPSERNYVKD